MLSVKIFQCTTESLKSCQISVQTPIEWEKQVSSDFKNLNITKKGFLNFAVFGIQLTFDLNIFIS